MQTIRPTGPQPFGTGEGSHDEANNSSMAQPHAPAEPIPLFQYAPPKVGRKSFGAILLGHTVFHTISNMKDFYAAMGYVEAEPNRQLSGEEFIWEHYTRDIAKKPKHCLQTQIQIYLHNNSEKFRELYGHRYNELIGTCNSNPLDHTDVQCANCPMARGG
jgi:hypothetical protein